LWPGHKAGLPGFQFIQDPIEYNSRTHHSNADVYDRLQADDLKQASVIMATFVYNAAMADERVPRKAAAPAAPSTAPSTAPTTAPSDRRPEPPVASGTPVTAGSESELESVR
jgi:hypothetical protein